MSDSQPSWAEGTRRVAHGRAVERLLGLGLFLLALLGYRAAGDTFYGGFRIPQGSGMNHLLPQELAWLSLFVVFGGAAVVGLTLALRGLDVVERLQRWLVGARGAGFVTACWLFLATLALSHFVLDHCVTTDDEHVYRFIAQTLRGGALTAPSPGRDLDFYREQFVVLTESVRFGKYPIGHPLLLALGQALGAEAVVVPILTAALALLVHHIGRRVYSPATATLACVLLALSPQVLLTGATVLSQATSALALLGAVACLTSGRDPSAGAWAGAGACLGYGVLARPLPGVLFVAVAAIIFLRRHPPHRWRRAERLRAASFGLPVLAAGAGLFLVNRLQTGRAFTSGYQAFHGTGGGTEGLLVLLTADASMLAMSVAGTLLRANVWLFGWPASLAFLPFARRSGRAGILWAMVGAAVAYRLVAPKVGVGGTGPLYLYEAVPLMAMLSADGVISLVRRAEGSAVWARGFRASVVAMLLAGAIVNLTLFLPPRLQDLRRMALGQGTVAALMAREPASRTVVFHNGTVPPWTGLNWAYFPRINSPTLDDEVIFLRLRPEPLAALASLSLWRSRYPDRSAFYFEWPPGEAPHLVPLAAWVDRVTSSHPAGP